MVVAWLWLYVSNGPHVVTISVGSGSCFPLVLTLLDVTSLAVHVLRRRPSFWFRSDSDAGTGWLFFFFDIFIGLRRVSVSGFYFFRRVHPRYMS